MFFSKLVLVALAVVVCAAGNDGLEEDENEYEKLSEYDQAVEIIIEEYQQCIEECPPKKEDKDSYVKCAISCSNSTQAKITKVVNSENSYIEQPEGPKATKCGDEYQSIQANDTFVVCYPSKEMALSPKLVQG
ncbi:unnamed protein product [Cylicocyclus nassatus]|uniref:Uncharacterized protein n=1 Tax=Cylicocyclus nassatus TaxID=53992 RepID=A0AA36MFP1_CYLNA|nr:unnamed protein product [Cylicocyclus nassatus]